MNTLQATISGIASSGHISSIRVSVGPDEFYLLLAEHTDDLMFNHSVTLAFKETEVILAKGVVTSSANVQNASVTMIEKGDILSQITLAYHDTVIKALIPTLTFEALDIREGDDVRWIVQPSEISLLRSSHGI
ncbi:hypothetical protein [Sulfuricurvum sp.]|uniref:hypothetical protein n=1 Tax=Sulfuricurvum sp. TaxID=2025608 RepID=UPI002622CA01|nr:hypothetical protein [Sulfuricurvum sp.]MDD4883462.1 hypothetical protein [Sulfuricurvum sp.]